MAKLYFRFGAMNCGKTISLLTVAHNYQENNKNVVIIKPSIDTKANNKLRTRVGMEKDVDILINYDGSFEKYYDEWNNNASCILVDEAQFLSEKQVEELWIASKMYDIPVICYGLRTDFKSQLFEGSKRLFELADEIDELVTICSCGKRAKFNARFENGMFKTTGDSILIDGSVQNVEYRPLCGKCYILAKNNKLGNL